MRRKKMLKIIGCMFIIFSSSCIGYLFGTSFSLRVREIKLLRMTLQMLETEITYSNTPLPYAFEYTSAKCQKPLSPVFSMMAQNLRERRFNSVGDAFENALNKNKDMLSLKKEDYDVLKSFGFSLGSSDSEGQEKSFKLVIKQLEQQEMKAEEIRCKSEKMYKSLGLLAGLAVTIILL
jgi:stage III sporulation protein AB